jgi:pimeloyl-ACP methyl ester carboxylesterase
VFPADRAGQIIGMSSHPSSPGTGVRAEVLGSGQRGDLVLVPGFGVVDYLGPVATSLARLGWRCWRLRPPGWPGNLACCEAPGSIESTGVAVGEWLAARDRPVVLVGQSIGTQIAAHAAVLATDRVRMLVLHGPTVDPAYRSAARLTTRWALSAPHEPLSLAASQVPEWWQVGPRRLARLLRACLADALESTVQAVPCPVRVVLGESDRLCRREWASSLTPAPLALLPGGHTAYAQPGRFARTVTDLLQEPR